MVISLGWLSPATSRGLPAAPTTRAGSRCLLGLAPTGGYRAAAVTRRAVGSYPTFSPLPLDKGRSVFCGPVRRLAAPRRYLAVYPVELGLSSAHPACRCAATIAPHHTPRQTYERGNAPGKASARAADLAAGKPEPVALAENHRLQGAEVSPPHQGRRQLHRVHRIEAAGPVSGEPGAWAHFGREEQQRSIRQGEAPQQAKRKPVPGRLS